MNFSITYGSILKIILILLAFWLLYQVVDVVFVLFFAVIVSSAVNPAVDRLKREGIPRIVGALFIYIIAGLVLLSVVYILVPPIVTQLHKLSLQFPQLLQEYLGAIPIPQDFFERLQGIVTDAASNIGSWLISLVGGIGNIIFVFVISFYLTVEDRAIKEFLKVTLSPKHQERVLDLIVRSQKTLSSWLRAQLVLMFLVGLITFIGLWIIGLPYKLVLSVLIGVLEFIPFAGPVIAAIPAILFSLEMSFSATLLTLALYIIVQQIESQILTPLIMKQAFQINPILIILALFIGAKLGGIVGILASVPLLALGLEFLKDYYKKTEA